VSFRCPAEPIAAFLAKGGARADTVGRSSMHRESPATESTTIRG